MSDSGVVALQQVPLFSDTDQRGVWLEEGATESIQVQTYLNGVTPPAEPVQLLVVPYDNFDPVPETDPGQSIFEIVVASGQPLPFRPVLPVGPDGSTTFTVRPTQAGIGYAFFFPFTGSVPPDLPASVQNADGIAPEYQGEPRLRLE